MTKYRCKNAPETVQWMRKIQVLRWKCATSQTKAQKSSKDDSVNPGDMVTRTGDREISVVSGRLLDNPGELACMKTVLSIMLVLKEMWLFLIYFLPKRGLESTMKSKHNSEQISLQIVTPSAEAHWSSIIQKLQCFNKTYHSLTQNLNP